MQKNISPVAELLGSIPNRLQLAGGWIDQPFVSRHNPKPPGSMVVVQIEPNFRPMDRSGIASSTRAIAMKLWKGELPEPAAGGSGARALRSRKQGQGRAERFAGHDWPGLSRREPFRLRFQGSRRRFPIAHRIMQRCRGRAVAGLGFAFDSGRAAARWLQSAGHKKFPAEVGRATWPVGAGLLRRHRQDGREVPWRVVQFEHEMLGNAAAAYRPASAAPDGFDAVAQGVSAAISRRDVFRLRRWLFDCRVQRSSSRSVQGQRPCFAR